MSTFFAFGTLSLALFASFGPVAHGAQLQERQLEASLKIDQSPSKHDWQRFMGLGAKQKAAMWEHFSQRGYTLQAWNWAWRIAWLRACEEETAGYCKDIFANAAHDKAAVVRAEAASIIGRRFDGSKSDVALDQLVQIYNHPKNFRNGKPLAVPRKVLFSIYRIGGSKALDTGRNLAQKNSTTKNYWQRLTKKAL